MANWKKIQYVGISDELLQTVRNTTQNITILEAVFAVGFRANSDRAIQFLLKEVEKSDEP